MDEKINFKAVEQYSEQYAGKILEGFFAHHTKITGEDILRLCDVKQINLFVVHELFRTWKTENKKVESPYFDYSAEPVKEALQSLMTILSNHISVDRTHFSPLLKRAVKNTLLLILDPYDFFSDLIAGDDEHPLEVNSFREQLKYLKINKAPLEKLLQKLTEKNISQTSGNEAFALLDQILEEVSFTPEDIDEYIEKFSAVVPLSLATFYEPKVKPKEQPRAVNQPKVNVVSATPQVTTVNDKLSKEPRPTLVDNFQKISKIKESLTINQKFMFTKVLFHGDFELFSKAVDDLDRLETLNAALRYLEDNYVEWDRECEEFHEFMELVEKRFS